MKTAINFEHTGSIRIKRTVAACVGSRRGFTLIEILTAVFILAVVVSLVMGSFAGIYEDADHINLGTDLHELGNACLTRMAKDLQSIHVASYPRYKPPDVDDDPEIYHVKGEARSTGGQSFGWLRFTSMAHLSFNQQINEGIAEVVYYVQQTPEDDFILRRADKLYPYPEEFEESDTDPIMCEHVLGFEIAYFDASGREYEEWDSESDDMTYSTPRAIGIKLTIGTESSEYDFYSRIALPAYRYREVKR
jgi:prepilin-type N-terminal cleavage/methylation domain-containing protein